MGIDAESINSRLQKLKECMEKLEPLSKIGQEAFLSNPGFQDIAERNLQVAIQVCLDIGSYIISALSLKRPDDYKEIFPILAEGDVIPKEFAERIAPMAGLRNILVHEYLDTDPKKMHQHLQQIEDFEKFAQYVIEFIGKV